MKKSGNWGRSLVYIIPSFFLLLGICLLGISILRELNDNKPQTAEELNPVVSENRVLFLSAAAQDYDVAQSQIKGLKSTLAAEMISLDVEYMDYRRFTTIESLELFEQRLKYKLQNTVPYGAVIAGDDETLYFCEQNQAELFKETPIIFFGVDDYEHAVRAAKNPLITGFAHVYNLDDAINSTLKMNPGLRMVYGIYDNTITGAGYGKQFYNYTYKYPELKFEGISLSLYTREEFEEKLESISKDSLVIHLYATTDSQGNKYSLGELASIIKKSLGDIPVYSTSKEALNLGMFGGNVIEMEKMAGKAALLACDVIRGRDISQIELCDKVVSTFMVDYEQVEALSMNPKAFPSGTVFINKEQTFWESYRGILVPFAIIFISLFVLLLESYIAMKNSQREKTKSDYLAAHDLVTGIPNRRAARVRLTKALAERKDFSFLLLDIDDFKNINDFFSQLCGDIVLRIIGERLESLAQDDSNYFVGRFGGDEFVILYTGGFLDENSMEIYNIKTMLNEPILYNGKKIFIKVSIGVVNSYQCEKTNEAVVTDADIALIEAKRRGKNSCVFFTKDMMKNAKRNDEVSKKLEFALENEEFKVLYQPQIDLSTGEIYGFEALTRLSDFSFPPSVFIPIAEEYGFISRLGRIVTEKVISQMAQWKAQGMELHQVAINFSSGQLGDLEYPEYLKGLLEKYDIPPELIEIEITESLFISNNSCALDLFKTFEEIGVKLALDDFGTGYSSLNYLTYMPVDTVKIDKSMVDNYLAGEREASFIKNLSRLVHGLGMKLTVEGVEEKWQLEKLKNFHADYIQGYYFSKPISGEDVVNFTVSGL